MTKKKDANTKTKRPRKLCGSCCLWYHIEEDYDKDYGHCQLLNAAIYNHKDRECDFPNDYIKKQS